MKNGIYKISFDIELTGFLTEDEATESIAAYLMDQDPNSSTEVNFELLEEFDPEYHMEDEVDELNFEESA